MPNTGDTSDEGYARIFKWLEKTGVGRRYGSGIPIGWYQKHQICAIEAIEAAAQRKIGVVARSFDVKAIKGEVYARVGGRRESWARVGSVREFFDKADRCARR